MILAVDIETTGLDFNHAAMPFFLSTCDEEGNQVWWEWDVDPLTRSAYIPAEDIDQFRKLRDQADELVLHNGKFDIRGLGMMKEWDWSRTHDTLVASHILASNRPHDLGALAIQYAGTNIDQYEEALKQAVKDARAIARKHYPDWHIGREDDPDAPSIKTAKDAAGSDYWLPRAMAKHENYPSDHPWWTVLREYANIDTVITNAVWRVIKLELKRRSLYKIYKARMDVIPVVVDMERRGVTVVGTNLNKSLTEFREISTTLGKRCTNIAKSYEYTSIDKKGIETTGPYELILPKGGGVNNSLKTFIFDVMKLKPAGWTDGGQPSMDKEAMDVYLSSLPEKSKALTFIKALSEKRKRDTAISYGESYQRFWLSTDNDGYMILFPTLNPTGTGTLRFSSKNPNEQNISKQSGMSMRGAFGPPPGYEWWKMDGKNLELRLPAYEAGETEMVNLFERPNDPPYFGSYHLLVFDTLHPDKFAKHGKKCKEIYDSTWYQWVKNGNFAVQYGAIESSGTADRAYHMPGAQRKVQQRFSKIAQLNQYQIRYADKHGYVETMPDKTVDPKRGYPLMCTRTDRGQILPTVPLNYHIQGTAMWWMQKAMVRCWAQLEEWNKQLKETLLGREFSIVMQVHDELVFQFPKKGDPRINPQRSNLWRARRLQKLMEKGGEDIGIPTPTSLEYHPENWGQGIAF